MLWLGIQSASSELREVCTSECAFSPPSMHTHAHTHCLYSLLKCCHVAACRRKMVSVSVIQGEKNVGSDIHE